MRMNAEGGKGFLFWEQMLASGSRIITKLLRLTRLRAEWPDTIAMLHNQYLEGRSERTAAPGVASGVKRR